MKKSRKEILDVYNLNDLNYNQELFSPKKEFYQTYFGI